MGAADCVVAMGAKGATDDVVGIGVDDVRCAAAALSTALLDTRLLNAGQPLQPACPPVPLQIPPPGHEPACTWAAGTYCDPGVCGREVVLSIGRLAGADVFVTILYAGGRLRLGGRLELRDFW